MLTRLSNNRWTMALRGILAIIFGLLAFFWPVGMLETFVIVFGVFASVDGIVALFAATRYAHEHERWTPLVVEGILGIVAGVICFFHPFAAMVALIWVAGLWALLTGALELVAAVRLRRHYAGEWLLALTGAVSVVLGIFLLVHPVLAATAYMWVLGIYAVIAGVALLVLSTRLRSAGSIDANTPHATVA